MTTSGSVLFEIEVSDLIEESAARAGVEVRSGFQWQSAIRTLNLLLSSWASKGLNLFCIDEGTLAISANDAVYDLPDDTVDLLDMAIRDGSTDYRLERVGVGTWAQIANKSQTSSRPVQAWVERLTDGVRINLWPVPNQALTLVYWRLRRIEDAGSAANTPDVPFRFVPALVSGLAYYLAMKSPGANLDRIAMLKAVYDEELESAQSEDRGRESFFIGVYTRGLR